jgi:hypothetical protein
MVAPGVVSPMATLCAEVYVPAAGRNVGVAEVPSELMVSDPLTKVNV